MDGGETMTTVEYNLPLDLTIEILIRLPAKSIYRFRCVSKTWCSILRSRNFADAFMSLSMSRPRLLLGFNPKFDNRFLLFSSPNNLQPWPSSSSSDSMVAVKTNTLTIPTIDFGDRVVLSNSVRGFVCCSLRRRFVVCNPTTGQVIILPTGFVERTHLYLGYDQTNDQYKVLRLDMLSGSDRPIGHSVCTLGGQQWSYSWRRIESSILYYPCSYGGVCIDGVVYYEASLQPQSKFKTVGSFDVGSEQLCVVKTPQGLAGILTNYLGKLASYDSSSDGGFVLWVLDDVKNQVWSKKTRVSPTFNHSFFSRFGLFNHSFFSRFGLHFAGVTGSGEIVFAPLLFRDPFELFFYHVENKVERRVRVEGIVGNIYDGIRFSNTSRSLHASVSSCYLDNFIYL